MTRDLRFNKCRDFILVNCSLDDDDYVKIGKIFAQNIDKISMMARLPAELNFWSMNFAICRFIAMREFGTDKVTSDVNARSNLELSEFNRRRNQKLGSDPEILTKDAWDTGVHNFESLVRSDSSGGLRVAAEAILSAMLVSGWAAVENLCVDLWVAAVNKNPRTLGAAVASSIRDKSINLAELAGADFDLRNSFGNYLIRSEKVSLTSFRSIKRAYQFAYGNRLPDLFSNQQLGEAEAIRHLYAHRSGRIDQAFLRRTITRDLVEGEEFPIDGEIVARSIDSCVRCGVSLLEFVDTSETLANPLAEQQS